MLLNCKPVMAVVAVACLSACMPELGVTNALAPKQTPQEAPNVDTLNPVTTKAPLCSAVVYAWLKGQPASAAESVSGPKRMIPLGSAVTMDHNPSRTNFDLGEDGNISRVWCG